MPCCRGTRHATAARSSSAPGAFGLSTINVVGLDDYVRGVVSRESPASWPLEALKAQAVAARTYAITTSKGGDGFDQYADTRSQVYGGVGAETASTDQAVAETAGQVVTYEGAPVVTYFFSTSGGRTEDVENVVRRRGLARGCAPSTTRTTTRRRGTAGGRSR